MISIPFYDKHYIVLILVILCQPIKTGIWGPCNDFEKTGLILIKCNQTMISFRGAIQIIVAKEASRAHCGLRDGKETEWRKNSRQVKE